MYYPLVIIKIFLSLPVNLVIMIVNTHHQVTSGQCYNMLHSIENLKLSTDKMYKRRDFSPHKILQCLRSILSSCLSSYYGWLLLDSIFIIGCFVLLPLPGTHSKGNGCCGLKEYLQRFKGNWISTGRLCLETTQFSDLNTFDCFG